MLGRGAAERFSLSDKSPVKRFSGLTRLRYSREQRSGGSWPPSPPPTTNRRINGLFAYWGFEINYCEPMTLHVWCQSLRGSPPVHAPVHKSTSAVRLNIRWVANAATWLITHFPKYITPRYDHVWCDSQLVIRHQNFMKRIH